jgi:manganese efflux pump family protein
MLAVFAVALAVGLDNFAAAVAIGLAGVDTRTRLRVGLVFGVFEAGMPIVGLLVGAETAASLGPASRWLAAGLLIAIGGYALVEATRGAHTGSRGRRKTPGRASPTAGSPLAGGSQVAGSSEAAGSRPEDARRPPSADGLGRLLLAGLALSIDNLAVGFALGSYHTSVVLGAVTIGAVSVALALVGLELGNRLGARADERGGQLAGLLLVGIGIAIAAGALS